MHKLFVYDAWVARVELRFAPHSIACACVLLTTGICFQRRKLIREKPIHHGKAYVLQTVPTVRNLDATKIAWLHSIQTSHHSSKGAIIFLGRGWVPKFQKVGVDKTATPLFRQQKCYDPLPSVVHLTP